MMFSLLVNLVWLLYLSQVQISSQIQMRILVKEQSNVQWFFNVVFRTMWKADNFIFQPILLAERLDMNQEDIMLSEIG